MTPDAFFRDYIARWEGGLSLDPKDPGNYQLGARGKGALVGSNHGVTPPALARHRGVSASSITKADMAALTIDEAADIAAEHYFRAPGFDRLPWNRVTASIVDMGWGAGPAQAVKLLQRMIGVADDGKLGPNTIAAYKLWLECGPAAEWAMVRNAFYDRIIQADAEKAKYRNGWRNRTRYFTADDKEGWFARWAA